MRQVNPTRRLAVFLLSIAFACGLLSMQRALAQEWSTRGETDATIAATGETPDIVWSGTHVRVARTVAFAPDGQRLASGGDDDVVNVWAASDGTLERSIRQCGTSYSCGSVFYEAFSADGQTLAATGRGLRFYRVSDGALLNTINTSAGNLKLSPDWQYFATSTDNSSYPGSVPSVVALFRVSDGSQVWQANGGGREIAFSPDGQLVASVGRKTGIDIWRASDGAHLVNIPGPKHDVLFSADGQHVISTQGAIGLFPYDDTINVYRVSDGAPVRTLRGAGAVSSLALTPDGRVLLSTGWDASTNQAGVIRFWRLSDGALLKTYDRGLGQYTAGIAVSPDGSLFSYTSEYSVFVARMPALSCAFSIDRTSESYKHEGGTGVVQVNAPEGCRWTAYSREDWVHITSGASGTGSGTVTYTVDTGPCYVSGSGGYYRHAILVIAEQTYDVNQNECPSGGNEHTISGHVTDELGDRLPNVSVQVQNQQYRLLMSVRTDEKGFYEVPNLPGGYDYTVQTLLDGYSFSPSTQITRSLDGDRTLDFTAAPVDCSCSLSAMGQHFNASAGSGFFSITTPQGCPWKVRISDAWINSYSSDGNGSATVTFYVEVNETHSARSGLISIGDESFSVTQDAAPDVCQYNVTPLRTSFRPEGGTGSVQVSVTNGCEWRARSNDFWITITSGSGASGNGLVNFNVGGNGGEAKTGSLTIAGQTITIEQEGASGSGVKMVEDDGNPFDGARLFWPQLYWNF
jgi:WD40 repeat protein